jgi:hypothetical protein
MSTKKTIQLNQDFLNSNNGGGGGSGNNRTLKNRERKEKPKIVIKPNNLKKQLLQKIKNYQNKDEIMQTNATLPITFDTQPNAKFDNIDADDSDFGGEFNKSLNFLQNLSLQKNATKNNNNKNSNNTNNNNHKTLKKKKVKNTMPQVATDLPPELCIQTTIPTSMPTANMPTANMPAIMPTANMHAIMPIVEEVVNENIISRDHSPQLILREQPLYSSLKNGSKPTYRQVHNKTQKITHFHTPEAQAPIQQPMQMPAVMQSPVVVQPPAVVQATAVVVEQTPLAQVMQQQQPIQNEHHIEEEETTTHKNNETQEPTILKKKITRTLKYKLGKKGNKVSILIKNGKTRKIIQHEQALLKKKSILDVKNYLRKKNLLKIGSEAPPDILRQIYENSILAGDLNNKSKETLIHNYMNDK